MRLVVYRRRMTQVLSPNDENVRDFTEHVDCKFRIDDDLFIGVVNIPGFTLMQFGAMFEGLDVNDPNAVSDPEYFKTMMELILEDDSAARFVKRLTDKAKPISLPQVMRILPWLMEEYGMRPPEPSSESSTGSASPGDGTSSTESGSELASTSDASQPIAS